MTSLELILSIAFMADFYPDNQVLILFRKYAESYICSLL